MCDPFSLASARRGMLRPLDNSITRFSKMKRVLIAALFLTVTGIANASAAELCNVPEGEWQPKEALQKQLEGEGVTIKKIKIDEGCYEVYGTDKDGKRIENYYDPKTFSLIKAQED
jgi:hypothetical protein